MAVYLSRRNKIEDSRLDANTIFVRMMKARLKVDNNFYSTTKNVVEFTSIWSLKNVL